MKRFLSFDTVIRTPSGFLSVFSLVPLFSGLIFDEENDKNNLVSWNSENRAPSPKMEVTLSFCYVVYNRYLLAANLVASSPAGICVIA